MFYKSTLELLRVDNIAKILRNLIYYIVTGKLSIIKNKTGVNVLSEKCFRFSKISVMLLLIMHTRLLSNSHVLNRQVHENWSGLAFRIIILFAFSLECYKKSLADQSYS